MEKNVICLKIKAQNYLIIKAMNDLGLNVRQLSEFLSINYQSMSSIINMNLIDKNNKNRFSIELLSRIAGLLGYTPDELFPNWAVMIANQINKGGTILIADNDKIKNLTLQGENQNNAIKLLENNDIKNDILRVLSTLTHRESDVIKMYFGINHEKLSLEKIGEKFNIKRERARQILEKGLRRMKHKSRSQLLNKYLSSK
jgi:RNA polymerase sigma factor (sigma-70 family)